MNLKIIDKWVAKELTGMLGFEDEVVIGLVKNMLESEIHPDPRELQVTLTGFLEKQAAGFVQELWRLLISAQESSTGIPSVLLDEKKAQISAQQAADRSAVGASAAQMAGLQGSVAAALTRHARNAYDERSHAPAAASSGGSERRGRHSRSPPRYRDRSPPRHVSSERCGRHSRSPPRYRDRSPPRHASSERRGHYADEARSGSRHREERRWSRDDRHGGGRTEQRGGGDRQRWSRDADQGQRGRWHSPPRRGDGSPPPVRQRSRSRSPPAARPAAVDEFGRQPARGDQPQGDSREEQLRAALEAKRRSASNKTD